MPRGTKDGSITRETAIDPQTGVLVETGRFVVRKRYTDLKGRRRQKIRIGLSESEANRLHRKLFKEIEKELAGVTNGARARTFAELVTFCKANQFKPAEYVGEEKVAGHRSWKSTWSALKPLEKYFGRMMLTAIDYDDLENYKQARLQDPVLVDRVRIEFVAGEKKRIHYTERRQRAIASVDRELAWARRMLKVAKRKKWITEHPFEDGEPLIEIASEHKRERILSSTEEPLLFAACTGKRKRLPFAITMALETGLRQGEQFTMKREAVDLEGRLMTAISYKGKKMLRRFVPISDYLFPQLVAHLASHKEERVFKYRDPKKAFNAACEAAGIKGLTWHGLRHTAITRMVHVYKIDPHDVMKMVGHQNWKTFFETYVNIDEEMARSIGARLDAARAAVKPPPLETLPVEVSDTVN